MKFRLICDWGMGNWAVLPTVICGAGTKPWAGWVYVYWLRGRIGVARW